MIIGKSEDAFRGNPLKFLAKKIAMTPLGRPVRVAIDGRAASGKNTFANRLADEIANFDRPIIRASALRFLRPRSERHVRGKYSAHGYYYDAFDYSSIKRSLLSPLGPDGNWKYKTAVFDRDRDQPIDEEPILAPKNAILIFDGQFLQRTELEDHWDLTVFLNTSEAVTSARGVLRDEKSLGGRIAAETLYSRKYQPAFALYWRLNKPECKANIVIENDDFDHPQMEVRSAAATA